VSALEASHDLWCIYSYLVSDFQVRRGELHEHRHEICFQQPLQLVVSLGQSYAKLDLIEKRQLSLFGRQSSGHDDDAEPESYHNVVKRINEMFRGIR
jgi:hypothetical protein